MTRTRRFCWIVLAALTAVPLQAQRRPGPGPGGRREMQDRIQQRFEQMVATQLGLDAATSERLREVVRSFHGERQELLRRQRMLQRRLRPGSGGVDLRRPPPPLPDDEAQRVLAEMMAIREREVDVQRREQAELLTVLTPSQLLRYYVLREGLAQRIRGLSRGGPGGGAWPPADGDDELGPPFGAAGPPHGRPR